MKIITVRKEENPKTGTEYTVNFITDNYEETITTKLEYSNPLEADTDGRNLARFSGALFMGLPFLEKEVENYYRKGL